MKHLSSTKFSKISKNNYFNEYITSLKDQIGSMKGEVLFLRQELRENNVPAEFKCIASTHTLITLIRIIIITIIEMRITAIRI